MPTLLIDASTPTLFVGAYKDGAWIELTSKEINAMEGLFDMAGWLFKKVPLKEFKSIVFCEGPGRLMSLRIAAVAANQWSEAGRKRYCYNSLELASLIAGKPVGVELRQGAIAVWKDNKIEVSRALPAGATLQTPELYSKALKQFSTLAAKIAKPCDFFDPPLWAPIEYVRV